MDHLQAILKGLFYRGGEFSHTKLWSNIGYGVFTWAIISRTQHGEVSDELWLIYISVVALHTTASTLLSKYKGKQNDDIS